MHSFKKSVALLCKIFSHVRFLARMYFFGRYYLPPEVAVDLRQFADQIKPYQVLGIAKKRFGRSRDGGYVMLDDLKGIDAAFSLGIGGDVSWDLAIAGAGIPVYQFDHTIDEPPATHPLFHFFRQQIGTIEKKDRAVSLEEIVKKYAPESENLILKMDIEGSEWEVLAEINVEVLKKFRQIVCEFHTMEKIVERAWKERAFRAISNLTKFHRAIHLHGNNFGHLIVAGKMRFPESLEMTLVRADVYQLAESNEKRPGALDRPNAWLLPDISF